MKLKIEEIEKLNAERTHGRWHIEKCTNILYLGGSPRGILSDISTPFNDEIQYSIVEKPTHYDNKFFLAAPAITAQYIKARRFEVTEDIIKEAHTKQNGGWKTIYFQGYDFKKDIGFARAILEAMWEEIENA